MAELTLKDESVIQIGESVSKGFNDLVASGKSILINPAGQPLTTSASDIPAENDFIGPRMPETSEQSGILSVLENIRDGIQSLVESFTESLSFQQQEEREAERAERVAADDPTTPPSDEGDTGGGIFAGAMAKLGAIKEGASNLLSKEGFIGLLIKGGLIAGLLLLAKGLQKYGKQIAEVVAPIIDGLKIFFERLSQDIGPLLSDAFSIISDTFTGIFNLVKGIFTLDGDLIKEGFDSLKTIPLRIATFLLDAVASIINSIGAAFGVEGDITTNIKNFFIDIKNKVVESFNNVLAFFTEDIPAKVTEIKDSITGFFTDAFDKIKNGVKDAFSSVGNFFSDIGDSVKTLINSAIDALPLPKFLKKKLKLDTKASKEADERITETGIKGKYVDESVTGMERERRSEGDGALTSEAAAEVAGEGYYELKMGKLGEQLRGILSEKELKEFQKLDNDEQMDYLREFDEKEFARRRKILDLNDKEYAFQQKLAELRAKGEARKPEFGGEIISPDDQLLQDDMAYARRTKQMREDSAAMDRRDQAKVNVINNTGGSTNTSVANNSYTNIAEDTNTSDNRLRDAFSA